MLSVLESGSDTGARVFRTRHVLFYFFQALFIITCPPGANEMLVGTKSADQFSSEVRVCHDDRPNWSISDTSETSSGSIRFH
jgi:hypothetical protein